MKLDALLVCILLLVPSATCETALVGIGRGKTVGSYVWELRIGRTVYVSSDSCPAAQMGQAYPATVRKETILLQAGNHTCKLRITDSRPWLGHRISKPLE